MQADSMEIRPPAMAGRFYPADPEELRGVIRTYLRAAQTSPSRAPIDPKAIITPHAGYVYSGPIAGSAFSPLVLKAREVLRIVLLGPSHRVPFRGLALSTAQAFATPLGLIRLDREAMESIASMPQVQFLDEAHQWEHSLEVELPFLQEILGEFALVPIVVGEASDAEVAAVLERLWGGPETRFVISSDLSHYLDYEAANRLDRATAQAIESLRPEAIGRTQACGRLPIRALLRAARDSGLQPLTVDLRNSGDTAGTRDRVVGYGAFVFAES